ncbi:hypothetical protein JA9_001385 [Meyerozyma sp. JA9]|nr:hypothetical protein JA9_001385 [Meyerozyma sp. JA9]
MSSSRNHALPSSKKTHSERHKQILRQLSKETANKTCADCKTAAHPRWASWNLGCFVCIRCSGIHRSMGTHISKVKSVDLDAWTDEQVESMVKWGNAKCNMYWEAKLPEGYIPDQSKIDNFIRTKYDLRKWTSSPQVPDPLKMGPVSHQPLANPAPQKSVPDTPRATNSTSGSNGSHTASLLDDFGSFVTSNKPPAAVSKGSSEPPMHRVNSASSAPVTLPSRNAAASPVSTPPGRSNSNGRPDLKKSILSLYSSPSNSTPTLAGKQPYSLSNSLSGLNLGASPSQPRATASSSSSLSYSEIPKTQSQQPQQAQSQDGWGNDWADSTWKQTPATSGAAALNNALDEDLFRNVWKQ